MLFRNIKTGNIISPSDEATVDLMQKSPIYEQTEAFVIVKSVAKAEPKEERKKTTVKQTSKNK